MDKWWVPARVADFIQGLKTGTPASPTIRDALETQAILDAILDSAKRKQWVNGAKA